MIIHTYGDSHSTFYGGWSKGVIDGVEVTGVNIDGLTIKTNHIPGKLAYSFGKDEMKVVNNVNEGDTLVFCFGEIDRRCHINKYGPNYKKVIDDIIEKYFTNIENNVKNYSNIITCVYNVVPPLERENPLNLWTEIWAVSNGVPALGSDNERKTYTLYMNKKIEEYCIKYGYIFFDVYAQYSDENGFLERELSDYNCHIRNPIHIESFIKKNIM